MGVKLEACDTRDGCVAMAGLEFSFGSWVLGQMHDFQVNFRIDP